MKWFGKICFTAKSEVEPGVWEDGIETKEYYGTIVRSSTRYQARTDSTNDNITMSNSLRIIADPFLLKSIDQILWVEVFGSKWRVSSVEIQFPEIVLDLGSPFLGGTYEEGSDEVKV